jgi:hypothetical protein
VHEPQPFDNMKNLESTYFDITTSKGGLATGMLERLKDADGFSCTAFHPTADFPPGGNFF